MPIVISCPQCHRRLRAPDRLVGEEAQCPCGGRVLVLPSLDEPGDVVQQPAPRPTSATVGTVPTDDFPAAAAHQSDTEGEHEKNLYLEGLRESLPAAAKVMVQCLIAAVIATGLMVYVARDVVPAAQDLVPTGGPRALLAPLIVAVFFGAAVGFGTGHRLTDKSGLVGWPACALGSVVVVCMLIAGWLAGGCFVQGGVVPLLRFWLIAAGFTAMVGISYYTLWVQ